MPITPKSKQQPWVKRQTITERYDKGTTFNYHSVAWRKDRLAHLKNNPLCAECVKNGLTVEASVSDHIIPIEQGGDAWDWNNRQGLCYPCHQSKSAKDRYKKKNNEATNNTTKDVHDTTNGKQDANSTTMRTNKHCCV